jgi:YbbR domain-containing protein
MALGLGTLLWFTITGERVERRVPRVPIYYSNLPSGLEITDQPDSVDVSVRGSYVEISRMTDLAVTANLGGGVPGANVMPLRVDMVNAPLGVEVTQIDPGTVTVYLEKSGRADVPVRPTIEGQPAPGFAVRQVMVDPRMVVVVGPEGRLRPTTAAVTERVSIEGLTETVIQVVRVGVADAQLRLGEPRTARVTVQIEPVAVDLKAEKRLVEWRGGAIVSVVVSRSERSLEQFTKRLSALWYKFTPLALSMLVGSGLSGLGFGTNQSVKSAGMVWGLF